MTLVPVDKSFEVEQRSRILLDSSCNKELHRTIRSNRYNYLILSNQM